MTTFTKLNRIEAAILLEACRLNAIGYPRSDSLARGFFRNFKPRKRKGESRIAFSCQRLKELGLVFCHEKNDYFHLRPTREGRAFAQYLTQRRRGRPCNN
jgi:hypothetical protein